MPAKKHPPDVRRAFLLPLLAFLGCGVKEIPVPVAPGPSSPAAPSAPATPTPPAADAGTAPVTPTVPSPTDASLAPAPPPPSTSMPSPPPADGAGVTIAGRFVPRNRAIVILHIGHSNMAGRATTPPELKPYFYDQDPHLWVYGKGGQFRPASEPTAPDNQEGQAAGPGMALLRSALAIAPPDAVIISVGHGHSGSFGGYCSNFRKGGLLYDVAMKPAIELKGKVTYAGIFTMFGQSEHNAPGSQQRAFADCLVGLAADMRGDLGEPELPFIVGDYEAGITRADILPTSPFAVPIIAQIQMVPSKMTRAAIIPSTGLVMQDDHHYNMAGHKEWAARGLQILRDHGWAPWASAP